MKFKIALLLSTILSTSAFAETYTVDKNHTFARFSYDHFGLSTQLSKFNETKGTVVFDKSSKTGNVDIEINTKSVETGAKVFDSHIQTPEFLDTEKYPTATFKSTKLNFKGDVPVSIDGNLTIKGVTKPVTFTITKFLNKQHPIMKVDAIGADAQVVIKRSEFNAGVHVPYVADEVTISVALEATAKKQ